MANDVSGDPYRGKIVEESDTNFKADDTIVKTPTAARAIFDKLRANHLKRILLYKEIEGLIAGNPPFNPYELQKAGLQHIANFNDMSARAEFERACLAYWNLLNNSENLTRFTIKLDTPEVVHWAEVMAANWEYAVTKKWPSFLVNLASLQAQLVKFGISPALFPDERDPRWRVVELHRFFIPDQAQADMDMLTTICVETEFTVQYLWNVYEEFKDRKATPTKTANHESATGQRGPWNIEEIGKLLLWTANSPMKDSAPSDLFELERKLLTGDISFDRLYNDTVRIVSLFQKEYNGKISHYMFHRHFDHGNFLFFQRDQFTTFNEALVLFTMNPGEYTIHANRGLGHKIYSLAQAKIMLDCSIFDMARYSSIPILKSSSLSTKTSEQLRFYPGVPMDIGASEFVQNQLGANINNVIGAAQYISGLIRFNIANAGADPAQPDPDQGSISPTQARLMAFREFSVLKNNIMHFYSIFDRLLQNMTAKMYRAKEGYPGYDIAKCWKERCIDDGVPEELFELKDDGADEWHLPKHLEVCATRAAGAGSQVAHLIGLQELQPLIGSFGPREEREYKRQFIMATIGPEYVKTFSQESDDVDERSGGASLAAVENAVMQDGKSPVFSQDNEHRAHFATHMALNSQVAQMLQQQQVDVVAADRIFTVSVPHTGEHLQALQASMFTQRFFEDAKPAYEQLVKYAALVRRNAIEVMKKQQKEQQQLAEQTQQAASKEQLETLTTLKDEQRKDLKLEAQAKRQERAGQVKEENARKKIESEIAIKQRQADAVIDIESRKQLQKESQQNKSDNGIPEVRNPYELGAPKV